jgi:triosephosphate isomerase
VLSWGEIKIGFLMRQQFIIGNWKMHMTSAETETFVEELLPHIGETTCFIGITPPFTSIDVAVKSAKGSYLNIGAQNMSEYPKGAYTGEISSAMLKENGATFVLIGHSERRAHFHENDEMIHRKVKWAIEEELLPVLCIGETQEERDKEMTHSVLTRQLSAALKDFSIKELENLIIAYEPVWAIGTGKTATPQIAQETHHLIRSHIKKTWGEEIGERLPLLYGGSVKPENAATLLSQEDIDGALIGGASLDVEAFGQIIEYGKELSL